jgi:hypothetical protein
MVETFPQNVSTFYGVLFKIQIGVLYYHIILYQVRLMSYDLKVLDIFAFSYFLFPGTTDIVIVPPDMISLHNPDKYHLIL